MKYFLVDYTFHNATIYTVYIVCIYINFKYAYIGNISWRNYAEYPHLTHTGDSKVQTQLVNI